MVMAPFGAGPSGFDDPAPEEPGGYGSVGGVVGVVGNAAVPLV